MAIPIKFHYLGLLTSFANHLSLQCIYTIFCKIQPCRSKKLFTLNGFCGARGPLFGAQFVHQRDKRKEHGDDDAAYNYGQKDNHDGLQQ